MPAPRAAALAAILFAPILFALPAGCGSGPAGSEDGARSAGAAEFPQRVVALAPNLVEIVFALGAGDRLVGVSEYSRFPPEAATKPVVGALTDMNFEALVALDPDLVLLLPAQEPVARRLASLDVAALVVRSETLADIGEGTAKVAGALGLEERGREVVRKFEEELERIRAESEGIDPARRPRVVFVVSRNPGTLQRIYACGGGNFLSELIEVAGAENLLRDSAIPWPLVGKEALVEMNPDAILDSSTGTTDTGSSGQSHLDAWRELDMIDAVRLGRVAPIDEDRLMVPGPGVVGGIRRLREAIARVSPAAGTKP